MLFFLFPRFFVLFCFFFPFIFHLFLRPFPHLPEQGAAAPLQTEEAAGKAKPRQVPPARPPGCPRRLGLSPPRLGPVTGAPTAPSPLTWGCLGPPHPPSVRPCRHRPRPALQRHRLPGGPVPGACHVCPGSAAPARRAVLQLGPELDPPERLWLIPVGTNRARGGLFSQAGSGRGAARALGSAHHRRAWARC